VCIGVGTDRANGVSDAATLRAVAELTAASAFYGCVSLDPKTGELYRKCIQVRAWQHACGNMHSCVSFCIRRWTQATRFAPLLRTPYAPASKVPHIGMNLFVSANILTADHTTIITLLLFFIGVCQDDSAALPPQLSAAAAVFPNASIQTKCFAPAHAALSV
jgi:hypothetical protein